MFPVVTKEGQINIINDSHTSFIDQVFIDKFTSMANKDEYKK